MCTWQRSSRPKNTARELMIFAHRAILFAPLFVNRTEYHCRRPPPLQPRTTAPGAYQAETHTMSTRLSLWLRTPRNPEWAATDCGLARDPCSLGVKRLLKALMGVALSWSRQ